MANPNIWAPGQALNANSSIRFESFIATTDQTLFELTDFQYAPGTGSLMVFISGIAQRPGIDFFETSASSFTLSTPVAAGTIVLAMGMVGVSLKYVADSITFVNTVTAIEGQTVFVVGYDLALAGNLRVYINGLLQYYPSAYTTDGANNVTFSEPLEAGDSVLFLVNVDAGSTVMQETPLEVNVLTAPTYDLLDGDVTQSIYLCDTSANGILITLPPASITPKLLTFKKISANYTVTVQPSGGNTIEGGTSISWSVLNEAVTLSNNGTNWGVV